MLLNRLGPGWEWDRLERLSFIEQVVMEGWRVMSLLEQTRYR